MRKLLLAAAVALTSLIGPGAAVQADEGGVDRDIGGTWIFQISGNRGVFVMNLGTPTAGVFATRGVGFSKSARSFFTVGDESVQTLAFRSTGSIQGSLDLEDLTQTTSAGTFTVTSGGIDAANERATLKGTLTVGSKTQRVVLRGLRRVAPEASLAGGSFDGVVRGSRIVSRKFHILMTDYDVDAQLGGPVTGGGYPFFQLAAAGPVSVDKAEVANFSVFGPLVDDGQRRIAGRVVTTQYGPALLTGRLVFGRKTADRPTLDAIITPDTGRRFRVRALLEALISQG